ncbi:MAG TPA: hypothetical protein DCQ29_14395, partial [Chitinophagaceae bacterium]|nr:hypothetical protein [Chitinophagaceae bacterium]
MQTQPHLTRKIVRLSFLLSFSNLQKTTFMKQLFVAIMALCITSIGFAQSNSNPFPRTINVTGSA